MFDAFKKLFSKRASSPPAVAPVTEGRAAAPAPPPRSSSPGAKPITAAPGVIPKKAGDMIILPLNEVLFRLPSPLSALVLTRPGGTFSFSASVALEQLRTGAVRISFSQLRRSAPPGTFADNTAHDDSLIDLPLALVLAAIGPAGLSRRTDQTRIEVPDEVTGVFAGKQGKPTRAAPAASAPAAAPAAPKPVPAVPKPMTAAPTAPKPVPAAPAAPKPVAATPIASPPTAPKPVTAAPVALPPAAAARPVTAKPVTSAPTAPKPVAPTVAPTLAPVIPKPVKPVVLPSTAPKLTTSIASAPAAPKPASPLPFATTRPSPPPISAAPAPTAAAPAPAGSVIVTTIEAVSAAWPESVRNDIQQFGLENATISIPVNRLESGMKSGRVVFTWAELCGWLSAPAPASANGQSVLELPLRVIAPLFLAIPRAAKSRKVVTVGENVPDLFEGLSHPVAPEPEPEPVPAPPEEPVEALAAEAVEAPPEEPVEALPAEPVEALAAEPAEAIPAEPVEALAAEPVEALPAEPVEAPPAEPVEVLPTSAPEVAPNVLGEILGQPSKTDWTPAEIVQGIMAMPGIQGALLASNDGLLVAGQMPAPLKVELMAAFLPQMFTNIGDSTQEVQLGTLRALKITTGEGACAVFKAGVLCLAVLGLPGETLPEPVLGRIADELAQPKY
jgi:predicted regulator of Ras-like GTPase activity (Roadblock/LC7/MglB family)